MVSTWTDLSAIVLAGGSPKEPLAQHFAVPSKAYAPYQGRALIDYVLSGLESCPAVSDIVVVSPQKEAHGNANGKPCRAVDSGESLTASLRNGLEQRPFQRDVLLITADLPFVTGEQLDDFCASAPASDLVYPIFSRGVMRERFPQFKRTYVDLKEGAVTGGNALLLRSSAISKLLPFVEAAYQKRKNPLALAQMFGWDIVLQLLLRRASA